MKMANCGEAKRKASSHDTVIMILGLDLLTANDPRGWQMARYRSRLIEVRMNVVQARVTI